MTATLTRVYTPRGSARDVFTHREPEVVISGPAGTGKSRACLEKLHAVCLATPDVRALIVRKTMASLGSTGLVTFRTHVIAESEQAGHVTYYGGSAAEPVQFRYINGSRVVVGGMDKATKIMSSEYDLIFVQEATELTEDDWEALTTRLRNNQISFQQLLADCNPSTPTHWLKQRADNGTTLMLHADHRDNPVLFDDQGQLTDVGTDYMSKLDNLTGVRKERLRYGRWVAAEGLIYDDFDPNIHLVNKPWEPPAGWDRYWSVDFGYNNPFVCQFWAIDGDGRAYLYREVYRTHRTIDEHARDLLVLYNKLNCRGREPKPQAIICDHDAGERAIFERELGMATTLAKKDVVSGIQAVQARLRPSGDGLPRLFLVRNARLERDESLAGQGKPTSTAEEIPGYVWDTSRGVREQPVKADDHGCDAMRYLVAHLDLRREPRMRWV